MQIHRPVRKGAREHFQPERRQGNGHNIYVWNTSKHGSLTIDWEVIQNEEGARVIRGHKEAMRAHQQRSSPRTASPRSRIRTITGACPVNTSNGIIWLTDFDLTLNRECKKYSTQFKTSEIMINFNFHLTHCGLTKEIFAAHWAG